MEENAKANKLLASGETLEAHRKHKEREKVSADSDLAKARSECEAEIARLNEGWAQTQARYIGQMRELQAEAQHMQQQLLEKNREAEEVLKKQSSEWGKCVDGVGRQLNIGVQALEDLCMEKAQALHVEALHARQQERDLAVSTQRRLEAQLNELKAQFRKRLKMEENRLGNEARAERQTVEITKSGTEMWAKRADCMREAFRGYAYKSGAYHLAVMDVRPRIDNRDAWDF